MKIELLHSVTHDGLEYLPGIHDLPEELAELFLSFREHLTGAHYAARKPVEAKAGQVAPAPGAGATRPAPDAAAALRRRSGP